MEVCKDYICRYVGDFVRKHWNKIDKDRCEIATNKETFLKRLEDNYELATWVITEVMSWGMDKDYLSEMKVQDNLDGFVAKFSGDNYIKFEITTNEKGVFDHWKVEFVEPKTKTVTYFD